MMMKYLLCLALIWALSILILWVLIFSITRPVNCASFKFQEDAQAKLGSFTFKYVGTPPSRNVKTCGSVTGL